MKLALVLVTLAACSAPLKTVNRAGGALALGTIACDWRETRSFASSGWQSPMYENNPIMGRDPEAHEVDMYFAFVGVAGAIAWQVLPEKLRPLLWAPVAATQLRTLRNNARWVSACAL